MNEEDLRLLQAAAAGFTAVNNADAPNVSVLDGVPTVAVDDNLELRVADLSADEINAALQVLAGVMEHDDKSQGPQPLPPPGESNSDPNTIANSEFDFDTAENSIDNLKKLLGFDDPDADVVDEILRQHNVSGVARGMDDQSPEIDYEGQLADLQKSLAELPHPVARVNSLLTQDTAATELDHQTATNLANWISGLIHPTTGGPAPFIAAPPAQPRGRTRQSSITDPFEDPVKAAEKERIRVENRERKKKWRNQNQERNKDNDLRCRVTKRAAQLYGNATSLEKTHWIEREFNRRRSKRVTRKEQRIIDNPAGGNSNVGCSGVFPAFSNSNSSSPPPNFSPVNTERDNYMFGEGPQPREEMVDVMHLLAALSGEPGMLATLMSVAVANGYSEEVLAAQCREESTPNGSIDGGDNGIENHDFTGITENIGGLADTLNTWTPEASLTPVPAGVQQASQQVPPESESLEDIERINRIEAGFEDLVANLERGLREHQDNQNANQEVKPEPKSPNHPPEEHHADNYSSAPTPTLEELGLDSMGNIDNIGDAIADLLKGQPEGTEGASADEAGEVEFDDEDIQRLIAEGGADVEMLLSSMEADGTAAAMLAQEAPESVADTGVTDYTAGANDRTELAQQLQRAGHSPNPDSERQSDESQSTNFTVDGDDLPMAEGMTLEEINSLLADLNGDADSGPMQLDTPVEPAPQQMQGSPAPASPLTAPASAPPVQPPTFNPDPDTSALYTKDTIVAIFKAILEMSPAPPLPRGTKRPSPGSYSNTSPAKRHRGHTPGTGMSMNTATMAALNQLNGLLNSSGYLHHNPHPAVSPANMQSQAYVASFGTTDGMNKRLMAMKPPPYRPGGSGVSGGGVGGAVGAGVQVKRKTGEEEKKVRAMGFPPLMAGMKRKL